MESAQFDQFSAERHGATVALATRPPGAAAMLAAWEHGHAQDPVERGLILLSLACPDWPADALSAATIGERDRWLLALRGAMFGVRLAALVSCDACGEQLELDVPIDDLLVAPDRRNGGDPLTWRCDDGLELRMRVPDSGDLRAAAQADEDAAVPMLMRRCVVSASRAGEPVEVPALSGDLVEEAARRIMQADSHADLKLALTCAACGTQWHAPLDIVAYLWAELDAWAGRMLWEIHTLASAYGWRECDVLALGPMRRATYLSMVFG
ncbi:hypothetical protein [Paraburkholderia sp. J7]|uniref:T4 family baseplate hub assembly chaperone n=1 Tax=Paraburkholderia sp. J7 TaxID=2805438 RepID=UPI002AB623A4|nr:hypothetical protein [Paraburkholderia sp. J7]